MSERAAWITPRQIDNQSGHPLIHRGVGTHDLRGGSGRTIQYDRVPVRDGDSRNPGSEPGPHTLAIGAYGWTTIGISGASILGAIIYMIIRHHVGA